MENNFIIGDHHQSLVVIVHYDDLPSSINDIHDNLFDYTEYKISMGPLKLSRIATKNISDTLVSLTTKNIKWAIVITSGNLIISQEIFTQAIDFAVEHKTPLVGHVLDRGGYFHIHPQFFVLDLEVYSIIGCPTLEYSDTPITIQTNETIRSSENVHDDYTPLWVTNSISENQCIYNSDHSYFGISLISKLVEHGYLILNVPNTVRNKKKYSYPDYTQNQLRELIENPNYIPTDYSLRSWSEFVKFTNSNNNFYSSNTEKLLWSDDLDNMEFDCYVGVAAGIKSICILGKLNFLPDGKIYIIDVCQAAIDFQQFLYKNWDGNLDHYESLLNEFQKLNPHYVQHGFGTRTATENLRWFLIESNISEDIFTNNYWLKYKLLDIEFCKLDLLTESGSDRIIEWVKYAKYNSYIWTSNSFFMTHLFFYKTSKVCQSYHQHFIEKIQCNIQNNVMLEDIKHTYLQPDRSVLADHLA